MSSSNNPRIPAARSLVVFQDHLIRGVWAQRHLEALVNDPKSLRSFLSLVECTREFQKQQQAAIASQDAAKLRGATTRNRLCLCNAVCPDESSAWIQCARTAVRRAKADGDRTGLKTVCEEERQRLEKCTQWASTRLLHAAVLPQDRGDPL